MVLDNQSTPAVSGFSELPANRIVVRSWERSQAAGVERHEQPTFRRLPADELQRRQAANRTLLDVAIPHLRWLSHWFRQRPHVVYLVDREGIVLHAEGDADAIARYRLAPGFDWSERQMGTNGAGTALAAGVPVAIVGCDHWSECWKDAVCLGAPIAGRDGKQIGALDISMDVQEGDAERLVVAAHVAHTISYELAHREAEAENRAKDALYQEARAALEAERRTRAEAELAHQQRALSEHRLRAIVDHLPALVYVVDDSDRFLLVNEHFAELFGMDADAVVGRSLYQCFPAEIAGQFAENNRKALEKGAMCEFEEIAPHPDGPRTYVSIKAPLYDADGALHAICGVSTDITERTRLMAALRQAQQQKDAALATIVHELRQPLGAIQPALEVMRASVGADKREQAQLIIERQVLQMARLVEDLLDVSRIAQGAVTLRRERTSLKGSLDAALNVVQPLIREREQHLSVEAPSEPVWLDADPQRLQQVFSNLLTNASKFTEPKGRIDLAVEVGSDEVVVSVRDTGCGITADALPHIFDLFAQVEPDGRGLGIGLSVVRGLVEQHGGRVEARSGGPGEGAELLVHLPLAPQTVREQPVSS